jgi:hypothetical protein
VTPKKDQLEFIERMRSSGSFETRTLVAIIDGLVSENEHYRLEILRLDIAIAKMRSEMAEFRRSHEAVR